MCLPGTVKAVRGQVERQGGPRVGRRTLLVGGVAAAAAVGLPAPARGVRSAKRRFQDLTHVLTEGFPVFAFDPPARETLVTIPSGGFYAQKWTFGEHSGTHMDAPGHFIAGGHVGLIPWEEGSGGPSRVIANW
jgi:hypothetical protein